MRILLCLGDKLCHQLLDFLLFRLCVPHDSLDALLRVFDIVNLITHLTLLLDLVALEVVLVEGSLDLIESPCGLELTRRVVQFTACYGFTRAASLYVVFDLTLGHLHTARFALNRDLIVELHQDPVWALEL